MTRAHENLCCPSYWEVVGGLPNRIAGGHPTQVQFFSSRKLFLQGNKESTNMFIFNHFTLLNISTRVKN
jgi:hypothetical protein